MNIIPPKPKKGKCPYCGAKLDRKTGICPICKSGIKIPIYEESKKNQT